MQYGENKILKETRKRRLIDDLDSKKADYRTDIWIILYLVDITSGLF